jgi:hypothetical protein
MSKKKKKSQPIKVKTKPPWKAKKGHTPHNSGAGQHDTSTKRQRTRKAKDDAAIKDQDQ